MTCLEKPGEGILSWCWGVKSVIFGRTNHIHINPNKLLLISDSSALATLSLS